MRSIGIRNLRSLADTGEMEIRPLTILLGRNSAGKSTFLRSFPLLRQSSEEKTLNDVLWFGDYVDFGTFWDSLYHGASSPEISFTFRVNHSLRNLILYSPGGMARRMRAAHNQLLEYEFELKQVAEGMQIDSQIYSEYEIRTEGSVAKIIVDKDLSIKSLVINGENMLPSISARRVTRQTKLLPSLLLHVDDDEFEGRIVETLKGFAHHKTTEQSLANLAEELVYGGAEFVLNQLSSASLGDVWGRRTRELTPESPEVIRVQKLLFAKYFGLIFDTLNATLTATFANVRYITPLRASAERYYRQRGIAVDEIAPNGDNVAMFLKSLTNEESADFASWTSANMGFSVLVESHTGHVSILIEDMEDKTRVNLADVGFGYSQVIPILAQVWQITRKRQRRVEPFLPPRAFQSSAPIFILIEQPELHLHPRMQSRLMELFYKVVAGAKKLGVDLRMIIETHSETMVAKAGSLIADAGEVTSEDIGVYLFDRKTPGSSRTEISKSWFDDEGLLVNWPYDFFDGSKQ